MFLIARIQSTYSEKKNYFIIGIINLDLIWEKGVAIYKTLFPNIESKALMNPFLVVAQLFCFIFLLNKI